MESISMDLACAALSAALANKMAVIRYMANRNKDAGHRPSAQSVTLRYSAVNQRQGGRI